MTTGPSVTTAEELIQLPDGQWRYELVEGQLRVMPLAGHVHGRIAARIGARLTTFVDAHRLGVTFAAETGFLLQRQPDTVRAPDASFVSNARLAASDSASQGYLSGPPDLAIEVLSPSDRRSKVTEKTEAWLRAGCIAVVVLDPASESATIHRSSGQTEPIASDGDLSVPEVLPGWSVSLRDIFRLGIG